MKAKVKIVKTPKQAVKEIEKLNKVFRGRNSVKVGLPKGTNAYPDGTDTVMVGTVHEFGSPSRGIPARSYLRSTMRDKAKSYKTLFRKLAKKLVDRDITMGKALALLGITVQTDVRAKITDISTPKLKGRDGNPLVDTGHLRQSITYETSK